MAYPATPKTWVAGDVLTAAQLNAELRDALLAAFPLGVGAWTTWTPTLTNLTLGSGTLVAKYMRLGRTIFFRFRFTLGAGSAVGTAPDFTLPVAGVDMALGDNIGTVSYVDSNTTFYSGIGMMLSSSGVRLRRIATDLAQPQTTDISATIPFTWATGDSIFCVGVYEAAS